jgi:hypothetical protein
MPKSPHKIRYKTVICLGALEHIVGGIELTSTSSPLLTCVGRIEHTTSGIECTRVEKSKKCPNPPQRRF